MRCDGMLAMDEARGHHARAGSIENSNIKLVDSISSWRAEHYHPAFSAELRTVRQFQLVKY